MCDEPADEEGMEGGGAAAGAGGKRPSALTIDRAAFLLLRVKRAFKKKRQQRKEKSAAAAAAAAADALTGATKGRKVPPPLLRSRTLPIIIAPSFSILQAQIDPSNDLSQSQMLVRGLGSYRVVGLRANTPRISFTCKDDDIHDIRRKSASSRLGSSPRPSIASTGSDDHADGNLALRVPSQTPRGSVSSTSSSSGRLSRFLAQGTKTQPQAQDTETGPRRLSWERRESSSGLPRSTSIDSLIESGWAPRKSDPAPVSLPVPRADRALSLVSPAVGRRVKAQRGQAELQYGALLDGCAGELPSLSCSPLPPHHLRKHKETIAPAPAPNLNIHLHALFAAVEHGHLDKARNILESTDVDVNSVNGDGLSPLDVAVLANNRPLARTLIEFGAREGNQLKSTEALGAHLRRLVREAETRLHEVSGCVAEPLGTRGSATGGAGAGTTGCAGGAAAERDKQALHWERRVRALKKLVLGLQQTKTPEAPASPDVEVCGADSVCVRLREHTASGYSPPNVQPITTKYRVQWSSRADFSNVCGSREVSATVESAGTKVTATGLTHGRRYFFRAAAGNLKGWGPYAFSVPRSVIPSSWRDTEGKTRREPVGAAAALDSLAAAAAGARHPRPLPPQQRHPRKKTATIRQLFTAASKFQKNLRRGVYLACVLYHEDKVLVTNEDFLPVIEVDETYPTCIYTDFHWLMKVACSWEEVKALRSDMEKHTSSSIHFRLKLLTAAAQMQSALCIQDLGQVYHKPLRDSHGTVVLACVNSVKSAKSVSALNSRWLPLSRLRRRVISEDNTVGEMLMASVHDQIIYHQVSKVQLSRGLYLGYLKLQSSVEVVRVVVPAKTPNVPPHTRIRENPHVSAEEWMYLKNQQSNPSSEDVLSRRMSISSIQDKTPSESQIIFLEQLAAAARRLFKDMEIPYVNALIHRLYDLEVIELNSEVSLVMICPPAEQACSVPGQKEILLQRGDLLSLPIQAFEMIHLQTYHANIVNKYSKLSCYLELDVAFAAHSHREAFSCSEVQVAKERLNKLEDLQKNLNAVWKAARWLMDLIAFARDKEKGASYDGILVKDILDKTNSIEGNRIISSDHPDCNYQVDFLQIPPRDGKIMKSSPGRGSWPGPAHNANNSNLLNPEMSKSEQHLSVTPRQSVSTINLSGSHYLTANSDNYSRKGSADSQFTQSSMASDFLGSSQFGAISGDSYMSISNNRLLPSRSEDALVVIQDDTAAAPKKKPQMLNASMSASSSPLLTVKGFYPGSMVSVRSTNKSNVTDSVHSLSSDSESQSYPLSRSIKLKPHKVPSQVIPSKSMVDVKTANIEFSSTSHPSEFAKPVINTPKVSNEAQSPNKLKKVEDSKGGGEKENEPAKGFDDSKGSEQPGILQIFAAYETGLAAGTSLKLHVTPKTTAREVIDLVVKQLNMATVLKGKAGPVYASEKFQDFCLVAVIGARERCLRDDFRPLQLQNPWRKGRLYVRLKHDVLAAIQHSAKHPAFI